MINFTRVAATAALTLCSAGAAMAADLPARVAPPAPYIAPLPIFTWTGPYFGINAGYAFDNTTRFNLTGVTPANDGVVTGSRPGTFKNTDSGVTAGGQIGYNYQFGGPAGGFVVGLEADAAYTDLSRTQTFVGARNTNKTFRSGLDYLGTVRGRVGYAFNQFLVYGTGGFAYGEAFQKALLFAPGNANSLRFFGSHSDFQTGFAYGGGIEYAIPTNSFLNFFHSSAVTLKAEYIHYDLGTSSFTATPVGGGSNGYAVRAKTEGNLARVGLNYKF